MAAPAFPHHVQRKLTPKLSKSSTKTGRSSTPVPSNRASVGTYQLTAKLSKSSVNGLPMAQPTSTTTGTRNTAICGPVQMRGSTKVRDV